MKIEALLELVEKDAAFYQRFGTPNSHNFFVQASTDEKSSLEKKKELFQVLLRYPSCLIHSSAVFAAYQAGYINLHELENYLYRFKQANQVINVEYGYIVAFLNKSDAVDTPLIHVLQKIQPVHLDKLFTKIQRLLNHKQRLKATRCYNRLKIELQFRLDDFDDDFIDRELEVNKTIHNTYKNDTKMLGHLFSLEGDVPCTESSLVSLTGSDFDRTAFFMSSLLTHYIKNCKKKQKYCEHIEALKKVRDMTLKAWRINELLQPRLLPVNEPLEAIILADCQSEGAEILTGWFEHGITLFIKKNLLIRHNGGGCSSDATIECYTITNPDALNEKLISKLIRNCNDESNKLFIQRDLHSILGLQLTKKIKGKFQKVGNCCLESLRISTQSKYDIFLPPAIANEIFLDMSAFIEDFYLAQYCETYQRNPFFAHIIMRLILASLLPERKQKQAIQLIEKYLIYCDKNRSIAYLELLLEHRMRLYNHDNVVIGQLLLTLQDTFPHHLEQRLALVRRFIVDEIDDNDWEDIEKLSDKERIVQGYSLLHFTVMNNNLEATKTLLLIAPKLIHTEDWHNKYALCYAQSAPIVQLLIENGARIDDDNEACNVLDAAMKKNNLEVVKTLLRAGAVPSKDSGLHASRYPLILDELLHFYPDTIHRKDDNYESLPHFLVQHGSVSMLDIVVRSGGNPNAEDVNGMTPLAFALTRGDKAKTEYLLRSPWVFFKNSYRGDLSFQSSIGCYSPSSRDRFQELFTQKENDKRYYQDTLVPNDEIENALDSLIDAICLNDEHAVRGCLLTYPGIDVCEVSSHYHFSPLHLALLNLIDKNDAEYHVHFNLLKDLLNTTGININSQNNGSGHILFPAVAMGNLDVLDLLLQHPALDVNLVDNNGNTALHDAACYGFLNVVQRLLASKQVDSRIKNNNHETADQMLATQRYSSPTSLDIQDADEIIKSIITHQHTFNQPNTPNNKQL